MYESCNYMSLSSELLIVAYDIACTFIEYFLKVKGNVTMFIIHNNFR
jgi:hypothetical protein